MSKIYKSSCIAIGAPKPIIDNSPIEKEQKSAEGEGKGNDAGDLDARDAANIIIDDAKQLYMRIVEEANTEAKEIIEKANSESLKIMAEAREQGYREGYEAGYSEGRKEAQSIIDEASAIREFLEERKAEICSETEEQAVQLILDIGKKVIGDELKQNREAILSLVRQAFQKCTFKKDLVLKVSPEDYNFVLENKNTICKLTEGINDIEITSDLTLSPGSCIVETLSGEINSSIDIQIKEIEKIFTYLLRNE